MHGREKEKERERREGIRQIGSVKIKKKENVNISRKYEKNKIKGKKEIKGCESGFSYCFFTDFTKLFF